ncbi:MAG: arylsulfatase A-like enzyme [Planctomycetota bacterium]|jgi:arylsulfatase A-like enzyme
MAALGLLAFCAFEPDAPAPSVLLISIDMLRADHVSCYGYERNTTPSIDSMAASGVRFSQTVSTAPWTLPAHASLFTSLPSSVHGASDAATTALAPEITTLAERFSTAGYRTAGFYAGPYLHAAYGLGQGFDVYRYCVDYAEDYGAGDVAEWGMDAEAQRRSHHGVTNPGVHHAASAWLDSVPEGEPFFAFVHLWDAHYDFTPPAPYDSMFTDPNYKGFVTGREFFFDPRIHAGMDPADLAQLVGLYDGEIRWTDAFVGKLLDDLERLGRLENTIVVLVSDHGTELFDHGEKGHRRTLYDEALMVPFVLSGPGVPAGVAVPDQVSLLDVGPTLLELCRLPGADAGMGRSLVPYFNVFAMPAPVGAVSELLTGPNQLRSLRTDGSKIVHREPDELYVWFDLDADPGERAPSTNFDETDAKALKGGLGVAEQELGSWREKTPDPVKPGELPADIQGTLKANGYTGEDKDEDD